MVIPDKKKILVYVIKIIISLLILYILFKKYLPRNFLEIIKKVDIRIYFSAFVIYSIGMVIRSYKFKNSLSIFNINNSFYIYWIINYISLPFNLFLPSGLGEDISKGFWVNKAEKNINTVVKAVAFDKITNLLAILILADIGTFIVYILLNKTIIIPLYFLLIILLMLIIITIIISKNNSIPFIPETYSIKLIRIIDTIKEKKKEFFQNVGLGILMHFIITISVYYVLFYSCYGKEINFIYFVSFIPMIILFQVIPVFLGGIGGRELGFIYFFGLIGFSKTKIIIIPIIYYGIFAVNILIGTLLFIMVKNKVFSKIKEEN